MPSKRSREKRIKVNANQKANSAEKKEGGISEDAVVRDLFKTSPESSTTQTDGLTDQEKDTRDKLRLRVEIVGLVFVIIYAFLTAWQAYSNSQQLKESRRETESTLQNFRVNQRAWIGVSEYRMTNFDDKTHMKTWVAMKNFGQTPAQSIKYNFAPIIIRDVNHQWLAPSQQALEHIGQQQAVLPKGYVTMVLPQGTETAQVVPLDNRIDESEYQDLRSGRAWLFLYGSIQYVDIFGESHTTLACAYYDPRIAAFSSCGDLSSMN